MKRLVVAFFVFVTDYFMRASDYAASTTCAQPSVNDFFVQFFPLVGPTFGCCRCGFGNCHDPTLCDGGYQGLAKLVLNALECCRGQLSTMAIGDLKLVASQVIFGHDFCVMNGYATFCKDTCDVAQ